MQTPNDRTVTELMEQLIETGPEGMAAAFTAMLNLAMRIERERHLGARPYERTPDRAWIRVFGAFDRRQCWLIADENTWAAGPNLAPHPGAAGRVDVKNIPVQVVRTQRFVLGAHGADGKHSGPSNILTH